MKKRCSSHRGDRRRHITPGKYHVMPAEIAQEHKEGKRSKWVPIKCAVLIDRNKYDPKTADRPKEAMKAAQRAQP